MKINDEQFIELLQKIPKPFQPKERMSDEDFKKVFEKAKVITVTKKNDVDSKKLSKKNRKLTTNLYRKVIGLQEKVIDNSSIPKTVIKHIKSSEKPLKFGEIDGVPEFMKEFETIKKSVEQYLIYAAGGLSAVAHDSSLTGDGTGSNPLKVAAGAMGNTIFGEVVAGGTNTFTLAHIPVGTIFLAANGQVLTLSTDYSIVGAVITTVSSWSAGTVIAAYSY